MNAGQGAMWVCLGVVREKTVSASSAEKRAGKRGRDDIEGGERFHDYFTSRYALDMKSNASEET